MKIWLAVCFVCCCLACTTTNNQEDSPNTTPNNSVDVQKARSLKSSGQIEQSKQAYQSISAELEKSGKRDFSTLKILGEANKELGNYQKGQYYYKKALEKSPDDYEANFGAGYCKFYLEIYSEAVPFFEKCYQSRSSDPEVMYYLARSKQKAEGGVNKTVLDLYQKSAQKNWKDSMRYLGDIYKYNQYRERAVEQYSKYTSLGGQLDKETQSWMNSLAQANQNQSQNQNQNQSQPDKVETVAIKSPTVKEVLMVCPRCGRLGNKETGICEYDGSPLEALQE